MRRLDDSEKRKKYPLWLSPAERTLLEAKTKEYGYTYMADYIRDAAIYESLVKIELVGADKMTEEYTRLYKEIRAYTKEVRRILKYATSLTDEEKDTLQNSLYYVYSSMKSLKNETNKKLDYKTIVEIEQKKLEDKNYEIYKEFLDNSNS